MTSATGIPRFVTSRRRPVRRTRSSRARQVALNSEMLIVSAPASWQRWSYSQRPWSTPSQPRCVALASPSLPGASGMTTFKSGDRLKSRSTLHGSRYPGAGRGRQCGVVNPWAGDAAALQHQLQVRPVPAHLGDKDKRRRFKPGRDLGDGARQWRRWREDARVSHDGQELVHARPRNGPRPPSLGQLPQACFRLRVPRGVLAVRVDQNIGIDSRHAPRPL